MASIFTKIIKRELPAYIVAEDDQFIAFLDINPLMRGHTLVVPKKEVDDIFDLDNLIFSDFFLFAKRVAKAMKAKIACNRVGITVMGLEVPHAHIHLIPINTMADMNFSNQKLVLSKDVMESTAEDIINGLG